MKALTLHQPWASLVAIGAKRFETRSWPAPRTLQPGDLLAIHASKRAAVCGYDEMPVGAGYAATEALGGSWLVARAIPTGCVLAVCKFISCSEMRLQNLTTERNELLWGDWTPGRYAWELRVAYRMPEPIPARGRQGLWEWEPPAEVAEIVRLLGYSEPAGQAQGGLSGV